MAAPKVLVECNTNLFRAASLFVLDEEVRYYITGVRVEKHPKGGVVLIATDGHRMLVVHDETGHCAKPCIVKLDKDGLRACAVKRDDVRKLVVGTDGLANIIGQWRSPKSVLVDGEYPDWRRVVPVKKWKFGAASYNSEYIGDFGKVARLCGQTAIRILTGETEGEPGLVLFPGIPNICGVLMPMRADVGTGLPPWMKPVMDRATKQPKAKPPAKSARRKKR